LFGRYVLRCVNQTNYLGVADNVSLANLVAHIHGVGSHLISTLVAGPDGLQESTYLQLQLSLHTSNLVGVHLSWAIFYTPLARSSVVMLVIVGESPWRDLC
jgi:hypothetical protein